MSDLRHHWRPSTAPVLSRRDEAHLQLFSAIFGIPREVVLAAWLADITRQVSSA